MFSKSFTCSVTTDGDGNFQASTPVSASHLVSVHVDVKATLLSPADTELNGTFAIAGSQANQFHGSTNETVDLGSWKVPAGSTTAVTSGSTNPARANTEISVRLDAHLV
jgi:hypothetical protein